MVEVCLRALGWRTEFLGNGLPAESYAKAIQMYKPRVSIISISYSENLVFLSKALLELEKVAINHKSGLIIGGRAIPATSFNLLKKSLFVYSMENLNEELPTYLNNLTNFTFSQS